MVDQVRLLLIRTEAAMSEQRTKAEREKARQLRKSEWWRRKLHEPICYYCQEPQTRATVTMDHLVPIAEGGSSNKSNIVVACKTCNSRKKDQGLVEWLLMSDGDEKDNSC